MAMTGPMKTLEKLLRRLTPDTTFVAVLGPPQHQDSFTHAYVRNGGGRWWKISPTGAGVGAGRLPTAGRLVRGKLGLAMTYSHLPGDGLDLFAARVAALCSPRVAGA